VADACAEKLNQQFSQGPGDYHWVHLKVDKSRIVLLKPLTYMNRSGIAVADARSRLNIPLSRCLIILDDLALPLGKLRLRAGGSDGGHHGLESVLNYLHSRQVPRLRLGIGSDQQGNAVQYVLSEFPANQRIIVEEMIDRAVQTILSFIENGIHTTMNAVNTSI